MATAQGSAQAEAAAAVALRACLDYMRVDEDVDGRIEHEFMPAAKAYLEGAGIPAPEAVAPTKLWPQP